MAASYKVNFAVSCTPVETPAVEYGTAGDQIASEVGKSLGGSGSIAMADFAGGAAVQGYNDQAANYLECVDNSSTQISSETTAKFVFIKNTGRLFSTSSVLGAALADHLVRVTAEGGTDTVVLATLNAGEAVIFKAEEVSNLPINCTYIKVRTYESDGSAAGATDHLAVEYLVTD